MKKIVVLGLLLVLFISVSFAGGQNEEKSETSEGVVFNETGLPIFSEPVEYTIMVPHPELAKKYFEEKETYKRISEETNVIINWEEVPASGWTEKVNLAVNSGELPDALFVGGLEDMLFIEAIEAGLVEPMDEHLKYAPNLQKAYKKYPNAKVSTSYMGDGKVYSYASIGVKDFAALRAPLFINKVWLDNLNLEVPKTTEDFYKVLKSFKENDPNGNGDNSDELPVTFTKYWLGYDFMELFGAWGISGARNKAETTIRDGKLYFHPAEDRYRTALTYFHTLFDEGIMDQESLTQNGAALNAKIEQDLPIVGAYLGWSRPTLNGDQYIALDPLVGPFGDQFAIYNPNELDIKDGLIIFSKTEYPEGLVRWCDYLNEGLNALETAAGPLKDGVIVLHEEDKTYSINHDRLAELGVGYEEYKQTEGTQNGTQFIMKEIIGYSERQDETSGTFMKQQWSEQARPYFYPDFWPSKLPKNVLTDEDEEMNYLWTDLKQYLEIFLANSVIDGINDDQWKDHLKKVEKLNYKDIVAYYQKMYDNL
ncbi:MAG: extracellular solute-binding protein [Spirochaetaceae bacterium]